MTRSSVERTCLFSFIGYFSPGIFGVWNTEVHPLTSLMRAMNRMRRVLHLIADFIVGRGHLFTEGEFQRRNNS
jgi:hypothetical protein